MINEIWLEDTSGFKGPLPYDAPSLYALKEQGVDMGLLLLDYHYNYWRLKNYIKELEGKIYELEETISGKEITKAYSEDPPF